MQHARWKDRLDFKAVHKYTLYTCLIRLDLTMSIDSSHASIPLYAISSCLNLLYFLLCQCTPLYTTTVSSTPGTFSNKYSTTPSGPLSTCRPCGIACVLIPGLSRSAISLISFACSGVHIDAEKRISGCCSFTVSATSSIPIKRQSPLPSMKLGYKYFRNSLHTQSRISPSVPRSSVRLRFSRVRALCLLSRGETYAEVKIPSWAA